MNNTSLVAILSIITIPILILVLVLIFRQPLRNLLDRVKRLDYKDKSREIGILTNPTKPNNNQDKVVNTTPVDSALLVTQAHSYLPDKLYSELIGRDEQLRDCLQELRNPVSSNTIALLGFGGTGKTALAYEIATRTLSEQLFRAVYWSSAKRTSLESIEETIGSTTYTYKSVVEKLIIWSGLEKSVRDIKDFRKKEERLKEYFQSNPCLIILDNLETANDNQDYIITSMGKILGRSKSIITSREVTSPDVRCYPLPLKGLSTEDAVRLMRSIASEKRIDRVRNASTGELSELADVVGGAPLALKLVVGWLSQMDLGLVKANLLSAKWEPIADMYKYIFINSWNQLDDAAQEVLLALSVFSPNAGASTDDLMRVVELDIPRFSNAISTLSQHSLIEVSNSLKNTRYYLHPLTINFVKSELV